MFKKLWGFNAFYIVLLCFGAAQTVAASFFSRTYFIVSLLVFLVLLAVTGIRMLTMNRKFNQLINSINDDIQSSSSNALTAFNLPVVIVSDSNEIVWYNTYFSSYVNAQADALIGKSLVSLIGEQGNANLQKRHKATVTYSNRIFDIYETVYQLDSTVQRILCFVDLTDLRKLASEYRLSRSVVAFIAIDNLDDICRNMRDSERNTVSSRIQNVLEDWFSTVNGISRRLSGERYIFIFEERDLISFSSAKFDILNRIRHIDFGEVGHATISIGIGHGANLRECEERAAQALDMALGRGGDQVAIKKDDNSFQFYGGISGANEKRTRVRTRIVASALLELIDNSEQVVLMGHKFADLDCFGAAFALCTAIKKRTGRSACVAIDTKTALIKPLLQRISSLNVQPPIVDCVQLMQSVNKQTLLIVLDTHRPSLTEAPELLDLAGTVVVIDHHRKAVDYIDPAVIFYHESSASSTCEMVSELLQYMDENSVGRAQAEALLSGIMLDTKNYCINTGVRTFEASAFLRRRGADPVAVKRLFSESLDAYKVRNNIIATAQQYKACAIAVQDNASLSRDENRILSSQAADELLNISQVKASFVISQFDGFVNISARSFGEINVQLIMEALGGGGHRMMAACQLDNMDVATAKEKLINAIDTTMEG